MRTYNLILAVEKTGAYVVSVATLAVLLDGKRNDRAPRSLQVPLSMRVCSCILSHDCTHCTHSYGAGACRRPRTPCTCSVCAGARRCCCRGTSYTGSLCGAGDRRCPRRRTSYAGSVCAGARRFSHHTAPAWPCGWPLALRTPLLPPVLRMPPQACPNPMEQIG